MRTSVVMMVGSPMVWIGAGASVSSIEAAQAQRRDGLPGQREGMMIEAAGVGKMNPGVFDGGVEIADLPEEIVLAAGQRDVESAAQRLLVAAEIAVRG